ncbi:hypothetical protein A2V97_04580 [Candidatus Woesebacteria bacterium RBG_16_42_24]|uniref:Uncharacterized protein n=1 Tax=Candidatus Woesebacteria bacterium RBG_16_42_24 TaxID=1802485 RepID=A0A1F7XLU5_9BACT|nr:MAG: hypothetical protein A2V97_04580 [Candidatus Woesebacteria bacterium RBG_16_42_24]
MLAEIRNGDLTGLLQRRAESQSQAAREKDFRQQVYERIKGVLSKAEKILNNFSVVPPERGGDPGRVSQPHRLSPPVSFTNENQVVQVRLRELVQGHGYKTRRYLMDPDHAEEARSRYGVRVELVDDSLPQGDRILFDLHPHMIKTWDGRQLQWRKGEAPDLHEIEVVEMLVEQIGKKLPTPQRV